MSKCGVGLPCQPVSQQILLRRPLESAVHVPVLLMSLNLLIETSGGFDHTGADCIGWMREAGFTNCRVVPLVGPHSVVIGEK